MVNRRSRVVQRQLLTLFNLGTIGELTDGQLLERFTAQSGEATELAFAALVERHGPMVMRVCRNTLHNSHDAQDAFQATFLVLVKKARSLWVQDSLGPWLHRVACRVATRARASSAQRREHERRFAETRPIENSLDDDRRDVAAVVHEEIDRLPERYRVPLVLCDLQGRTHEQAARHVGCPVGTVKSRLGRARELLRGRLSRRGLGSPAGLLTTALGSKSAEGVWVGPLVEPTVRAAALVEAGKASRLGVISARVAFLTEEVLKAMFLRKLKMIASILVTAGALATVTAVVLAQQGSGSTPITTAEQPIGPPPAGTGRAAGAPVAPATSQFKKSRRMMITRLESETAKAKEILSRTLEAAGSQDAPAVVRARKTVEEFENLLARIDSVFVDAVRLHPEIFDPSLEPTEAAAGPRSAAAPPPKNQEARIPFSADVPDEADVKRAKERAEWADSMAKKGYVSKTQADHDRAQYEAIKQARLGNRSLANSILDDAALKRVKDRVDWAAEMHKKGYASQRTLEDARKDYEDLKRDIARALDRMRWAESSFREGYIRKEQLDSAYRDYENARSRGGSERPASATPDR
jgi:RNA polymerase sigma factor (sigma-70 family)